MHLKFIELALIVTAQIKFWQNVADIGKNMYVSLHGMCFLKKFILGKHCIRNAYSVFRHLKSHIISDLDMMSRRYSLQTTHTRLLIKQQKLDCFAFFCETVRVHNKLLEKKKI